MTHAVHGYQGYEIMLKHGSFNVLDPRFPEDGSPAIYKATSLDAAKKWIDAYRAGHQWAVDARCTSSSPAA